MSGSEPTASADPRGQLRAVVDGVRDYAIFVIDAQGIVRTWNDGAREIKGYAPEEIIGQSFERFYTPEDRAAGRPATLLAAAAADGRVEEEGWRIRKDGARFWADVVITALRDDDGTLRGFLKVTRDLTARRNADEQRRQSEELLRLMVESVHDHAIYMLDADGSVATWNAGAERIEQYRADEVIETNFARFYPPEDVAAGKPAREIELATTHGRAEDEGWRVRKDGTRFWASVVLSAVRDTSGRLLGFTKVTRDMTQRRLAEQELAARAGQQAAVADLGVFALRASVEELAGRAVAVVRDTLGTDVADLVAISATDEEEGYGFERLASVGFRAAPAERRLGIVDYAVRTNEAIVVRDLAHEERFRVDPLVIEQGLVSAACVVLHGVGPDARPRGVLVTYARGERAYEAADGDFLHAVANVLATAIIRAELEEQQHLAARAAAEARIRAVRAREAIRERDEFISIAGHELRTPLTALLLKLESARHGLAASPVDIQKLTGRLDGAVRQSTRLAGLVDRLLDVSRAVSGAMDLHREPVDLAALVRRAVDDLRENAQRAGSTLELHVPDTLVVACDGGRIEQVVANLLTNAIKYGGGKPIAVDVEKRAEVAVVAVTDHGIGIASDDLERIFGRFERAAPSGHYGGLGLGLYITRRIVEAHGGCVRVDTEPERGSVFSVELPMSASEPTKREEG